MYSPKISEDLIPDIYRLAKAIKKPMTAVVNDILADALNKVKVIEKTEPCVVVKDREVYELVACGDEQ